MMLGIIKTTASNFLFIALYEAESDGDNDIDVTILLNFDYRNDPIRRPVFFKPSNFLKV